jgi:hypothetical protein
MILGDSAAMLLAAGFAGPIWVFQRDIFPFDFLDVGCDFHWLCSRYLFISLAVRTMGIRRGWLACRLGYWKFLNFDVNV